MLAVFRFGLGFLILLPVALRLRSRWPRGRDWLGVAALGAMFYGVFFVVYGLIGLEIALDLFGARQGSAFKRFLDTLTLPVLGPFRGLMHDPALGAVQFMFSYVVAMVVYALLHCALNGLLRLFARRKVSL